MTLEALRFLRDLLSRQQISAETPNLIAVASTIERVRAQLDEAIAKAEHEEPHIRSAERAAQ